MANEATLTPSLSINFNDGTAPFTRKHSFQADVSTNNGPTPGALTATVSGVEISLAQLTTPGLAWVQNNSPDYTLTIGIKDTSSGAFTPLLDFLPGESYPVRLSQFLGQELTAGSGTGTDGSGGVLWAKGIGGSVGFSVEAFEL